MKRGKDLSVLSAREVIHQSLSLKFTLKAYTKYSRTISVKFARKALVIR
jgi:hypothetical protein